MGELVENATEFIDACPSCDAEIRSDHIGRSCPRCGGGLPHEIYSRLPQVAALRSDPDPSQALAMRSLRLSRDAAIVVGIIGFVLLVVGALRWNSLESQMYRAFGESDNLGIVLLLAGTLGLLTGGWGLLSGTNAMASRDVVTAISVEERLRHLKDLRSKNLIDEDEYRQRKHDIISTV